MRLHWNNGGCLGKYLFPKIHRPVFPFDLRRPRVSTRDPGARHRRLGSPPPSGTAAAPIGSLPAVSEPESRVLGVSFLRFLKGSAGALLLYVRHRADRRAAGQANFLCDI